MPSKLILSYFFVDFLFLGTGCLMLGFTLVSQASLRSTATTDNVGRNLLLAEVPLTAGIINAVIVFATFVLSLPVFLLRGSRIWLKLHGWLVTISALITLCIGVAVWVETLQTRRRLNRLWTAAPLNQQSLLQQRFNCCGYVDPSTPAFVPDNVCSDLNIALRQLGGCEVPFSNFANNYLDQIFTAMFGTVGLDALLILWIAMVNKNRQEQARYKEIDQKNRDEAFST